MPALAPRSRTSSPSGASSSSENRYTIGPTAEIHLPLHLSFEVDALYRRSGFFVNGAHVGFGNAVADDWQIPLLGKYEIPLGPIRPFADAGVVCRHVSASNLPLFSDSNHPNSAEFAVGGGVGLKWLHFRISPEIRYTHWGQTAFSNSSRSSATAIKLIS